VSAPADPGRIARAILKQRALVDSLESGLADGPSDMYDRAREDLYTLEDSFLPEHNWETDADYEAALKKHAGGEPLRAHPKAAGMRAPGAPEPRPPLSESLPLNAAAGVLGGLASRGGAGIAQGIPVDDEDVPKREYASGSPGAEAGNLQRNLDEEAGRGAEYNPKSAMAARTAGTAVRNLPVSLIPGGLLAQVAASVPVTAANLAFDAATEGANPVDAVTQGWEPYALNAGGALLMGGLPGAIARSRWGKAATEDVGGAATRMRMRSTGASKASVDKVHRGKGGAKVDAIARGIEDEGWQGFLPSTPDQIARRAAEAEPQLRAELDAANTAVAAQAPGMKASDIRQFFTSKAEGLEGLAAKYGDDSLTSAAGRWRKKADALMTDVFENRPEAPRTPSRARPFTDSGGSKWNEATGKYDVTEGNQRPAAFTPLPRGTPGRSPTSGQKPYVHEAEDLAHPGIMKPDPQYEDTLQIPISQGAINKSWMDLLEMRRHWDNVAKKAYEGQDAIAAREAREVATFLRRSMSEMADALPGEAGARVREANRRYELTAHVEDFAADQLYAITPGDQMGRDAARGAAAGGPAGAAAAVAATASKGRWPDMQARRLRAAESRLRGYPDPGSKTQAVLRSAAAAPVPSGVATGDAIRREIERQRQARDQ
jgi:hypothetical protein